MLIKSESSSIPLQIFLKLACDKYGNSLQRKSAGFLDTKESGMFEISSLGYMAEP